ncbi:DUF3152 domain-containing protein [Streptomyces sp. GSL17-111]|uniref:DUF3152 domain-containing protein n=1 Tax=Streptomyces sp. GSL17-111 TaxID=3121596 RepID=UPI0030F384BE
MAAFDTPGGAAAEERDEPAAPRPATASPEGASPATGSPADPPAPGGERSGTGAAGAPGGTGRLRMFTGLCAAAVTAATTLLVLGQDGTVGESVTQAADGGERAGEPGAEQDGPGTDAPTDAPPEPTYEERLATATPVDPDLTGPGSFTVVPGTDPGAGRGTELTYRVEVEDDLGLDPELFARAVHSTLTDERSWSHEGRYSFERVAEGEADFVMTLASPGTTAEWCAKSGLDTTVDNVSCDSASTERIMINAYRWGEGSPTYGPDLLREYREMLINHEVGHRLGLGHVGCEKDGDLAPVMMQQTKTLSSGSATCRPNAWPHPEG